MAIKVWKGKISSGQAISSPMDASYLITDVIITNTSGSNVDVGIQIFDFNNNIYVSPAPATLTPGQSYSDNNIPILNTESIKLTASGGVDYFFSLKPEDCVSL